MGPPEHDAGEDRSLADAGAGGARPIDARGDLAPATGGAPGAGGSLDAGFDAAKADARGTGGVTGSGGQGAGGATGAGGSTGTGGRGVGGSGAGGRGAGGTGAGGTVVVDAGAPDVPRVCAARFNFEAGALYGAFINTGYQTGFSNLVNGTDAACGTGAMRMNLAVTPTADKGEVIVPLGATQDLRGKTLSLAVKVTPAPGPNAYVLVFLVPSYTPVIAFSPIPSSFTTSTVTLPSVADAGAATTSAIAIQVLGRGDTYGGVFSVDELDLR